MNRTWLLTIVAICLVAGIGGAYFLFRDGPTKEAVDDANPQQSETAQQSDEDSQSVTQLRDAVVYADSQAYYQSPEVANIKARGEGVVMLPAPERNLRAANYVRQKGFVGPESCRECHQKYYDGFVETAHYHTSSLPTDKTIHGNLSKPSRVSTSDSALNLEVGQDEQGRYQKAFVERGGKTYSFRENVELVTGSGNHGQTFLYWKNDFLYEMPVTWYTSSQSWVHSPGYSGRIADFARPIGAGCISCHATLFENDSSGNNRYDQATVILGVSCERCHGPGEKHVNHHRENPDSREPRFITHPNHLARERMNDVCGQCHSGTSLPRRLAFNFRPGDRLANFIEFPKGERSGSGVHTANQHVRMALSKCYTETDDLNCASCHNPHQNERGNLPLFSKRCIQCHEVSDCGKHADLGDRIAENCIDCHMPKQDDTNTRMATDDKAVFPQIRDHFIRPYDEATEAVLKKWLAAEKTTGPSEE